uniref:Orn/DAP/Arg decarboxylase 2 N-terminal domain-containing protein n=1 Tax=Plectus sambesii TaxID=2011161 RepID=A0A914W2L6_9BILA
MTTVASRKPWWLGEKEALLRLAARTSPAFVYSKRAIVEAVTRLRQLSSVDRLFFAVKANHNDDVLRTVESLGVGFECVSLAELNHVQSLFHAIDADRLLFTPNFAPKVEYEAALSKGVHVTIDSPYPLEKWPELFAGRDIILRVDPGSGNGHHQFVHTAGKEAKFGADADDIEKIKHIADDIRCRVVGIHSHAGSGILDEKHWVDTTQHLYTVKQHFKSIHIVNIGGGLGIPQSNFEQNPINFTAFDAGLSKVGKASLRALLI